MKKFLFGVVFAVIAMLAVLNVHIIRSHEGVQFLKKDQMILNYTYVDIRDITMQEFLKLPPKVRKHVAYEKPFGDIKDVFKNKSKDLEKGAKDAIDAAKEKVKEWTDEKK